MNKSLISVVRRTLGFKGKTEHSGRGFYMMTFECESWEEMKKGVQKLINKLTKEGTLTSTKTFKKIHPSDHKEYEFIEVIADYDTYGYYSIFNVNEYGYRGPFVGVWFTLNPKEYPDTLV